MSARNAISPGVRSMITQKLQDQGIELYDLEYKRESNGLILRIYIDTIEGVDTDTCVTASQAVKNYIDTLADVDYDYLEVSSPGIDRVLKRESDLVKNRGSRVLVKTSQPVDGRKKFIGILLGINDNRLDLQTDQELIHVDRDLVSVVRLHPDI